MTPEIMAWGGKVIREHRLRESRSTLEIGAFNVNGSLREFFPPTAEYCGIDQFGGPGVDLVANIRDFEVYDDLGYDLIICTEVIEHDPRPWEVLDQIGKLLAPGGHLILTAPSIKFPRHDYPGDYFRYTESALRSLAEYAGLEVIEAMEIPGDAHENGVCTRLTQATSVCLAIKPTA